MANSTNISTIAELKAQEELVRAQLKTEEKEIARRWNELFKKGKSLPKTPAERAMSLFTKGSGAIDGLILGWKLYKKFRH